MPLSPHHFGNLAHIGWRCNRFKGPNLVSVDPETGAIMPLFNPRTDDWHAHFRWEGAELVPLTAGGRATVALLQCGDAECVALREPHPPGPLSIPESLISLS